MVEHYGGDVWVEDRADSHLGGVRPTADASTDGGTTADEPRGTMVVIELPVAGATATSAADD